MIGDFLWSQGQIEYLIWRIKKNTDKSVKRVSTQDNHLYSRTTY
jgi:hypothetical protein